MKHSLSLIPTLSFALTTLASGSTIVIDGNSNEFADYSSLNEFDVWGTSSNSDGTATLSVINDSPIVVDAAENPNPGLTWSISYSSGSYTAGSEINFFQGQQNAVTNFSDAIDEDKFMTVELTSSTPFDWTSVSATLWRNGAGAARFYQFAYSPDSTWDTSDLLGSPKDLGAGGISDEDTLTFDASTIVSGTTSAEVRLYFYGGTSNLGNTHLTSVSADYSVIPEPAHFGAILAGIGLVLAVLRRKRIETRA